MPQTRSFKRPLLYILVASVLLAAVLGIVLVLRNTWGWFEIRVILTTVIVAIASVCGLACDLSRTPKGLNLMPVSGLVLTVLAAGMILIGMWTDLDSEIYWKATSAVSIFAVATAHLSLLTIARLTGHFRWVLMVAGQIIFGLAVLLVVMIFWEIDTPRMFRFLAALSILDAAVTLVIPILHRISKTHLNLPSTSSLLDERNLASIDAEIAQLTKRIAELQRLRTEVAGARNIAV